MRSISVIFRLFLAVFVATWTPLSCCCLQTHGAAKANSVALAAATAPEHACCDRVSPATSNTQHTIARCADEAPASQRNHSWPCSKSSFVAGPAEQTEALSFDLSADHLAWFINALSSIDDTMSLAVASRIDKPQENASPHWQRTLWSQRCSMQI